jgi:hypothetical protein
MGEDQSPIVFTLAVVRAIVGIAFFIYLTVFACQFLSGSKALVVKDGQFYVKELGQ